MTRRLRWASVGAALVVLALAVLLVLHTPWYSARVVVITGEHPHTPDAAILAASGLDGHPPLVTIDGPAVAARIERLPWVASATVHLHWPDAVTVSVTERVPVGVVNDHVTSWAVVDGGGRTLSVGPDRPAGLVVLIDHDGAAYVDPGPVGSALPPSAAPLLAVARTLPPAFVGQVVSATLDPDGTVHLALTTGLTVLLGTDADLGAKYEDVAAIIAHADLHGAKVIDVTVPESPTVSP
jgi:cell division protein FtsQ